jgi:hypothetical protein
MNHPHPSDRTHVTDVPPSPEFWILTSGFSPRIRNEPHSSPGGLVEGQKCKTNPIPPRPTTNRQQPKAIFTKRTQFTTRSLSQRAGIPRLCETNPICPTPSSHRPKNTKRSQFHPGATVPQPKNAKRSQFHRGAAAQQPKNAKRTQLPPISRQPRWPKVSPDSSGNPISAYPASRHPKNAKRTQFAAPCCLSYFLLSTFSHLAGNSPRHPIPPGQQPIAKSQQLFLRNEPNFHPLCLLPRALCLVYAKRTQFPATNITYMVDLQITVKDVILHM